MKKTFVVIFLTIFGCLLFADSYTVKAVKGKNGSMGLAKSERTGIINIGQELFDEDYINLFSNSYIELDNGCFINESGFVKNTIETKRRLNGVAKLKRSEIADVKEGTSKGTATASTRASEVKEDVEWDE